MVAKEIALRSSDGSVSDLMATTPTEPTSYDSGRSVSVDRYDRSYDEIFTFLRNIFP